MRLLARVRPLAIVLVFLGRFLSPEPSHALLRSSLAFVTSYKVEVERAVDSLLVSPDAAHVYTAAAEVVNVMARNSATGQLGLVQTLDASALGAHSTGVGRLAMSPDGKHVYHFGLSEYAHRGFVGLLTRDLATGMLVPAARWEDGTSGITGMSPPRDIAVSPDGEHLYVMGSEVVVFDRDPVSGALTFVEAEASGPLDAAAEIAVSPDGANVYVRRAAGGVPTFLPQTLFVFDRDAGTGGLTFRESHANVDESVVVSPDGMHVYAGGKVFERDPATGSLTFAGTGLSSGTRWGPAFSPDGGTVYLGSEFGSIGVWVYARDLATGALTLVGNSGGPDDDGYSRSLAVSPDGRHVYAGYRRAGYRSDGERIALLQRVAVTCGATPEPSCRGSTTPGGSLLQVKNPLEPYYATPGSEAVRFHLGRGEATDAVAIGDPATTDYAVCVYEQDMGVPRRQLDINVESGNLCRTQTCWNRTATGSLTFRDSLGQRDGLRQLKLKAGADGKASVSFRVLGKETAEGLLPPLALPVLVQVLNSLGECWEQSFGTPLVNSGTQFKAKQ